VPSNQADAPLGELEGLLQSGISAARIGHDGWAREMLTRAVELDPDCLQAWLWLSGVAWTPEEQARCLEQVLRLDPDHDDARRDLDHLRAQIQQAQQLEAQKRQRPDPVQSHPRMPSPDPRPPQPCPVPLAERSPSLEAASPWRAYLEPDIPIDAFDSPEPDLDALLQAGISAASAHQADVARELLGRVIQVDEKYIAAWLWLSYVADTSQERDRCVKKMLDIAGFDATPRPPAHPASQALAADPTTTVQNLRSSVGEPTPALKLVPALAAAGAPASAPDSHFWGVVALDPAAIGESLRRAVFEWTSVWALTAQAYLLGIVVAELLITFAPVTLGLLAHSLLLVTLLVHASRVRGKAKRAFLMSMAFAPLIRILSLSLPMASIPIIYWYLITSVPLFAALIVAARTLGFSWHRLGLNLRGWPLQLAIGLTGIAFGIVEYHILEPQPLAEGLTLSYLWRPALILMVSTGLLEEMIFRGLLQRTSIDSLGRWGLFYVPLLFAVLHIGYMLFVDVVFVFFVGLFFTWIVWRTRSLLGVTVAHGLTNIVLFLVMPFVMA
jgi:membrane protease YdiL (CAAX protease family)